MLLSGNQFFEGDQKTNNRCTIGRSFHICFCPIRNRVYLESLTIMVLSTFHKLTYQIYWLLKYIKRLVRKNFTICRCKRRYIKSRKHGMTTPRSTVSNLQLHNWLCCVFVFSYTETDDLSQQKSPYFYLLSKDCRIRRFIYHNLEIEFQCERISMHNL